MKEDYNNLKKKTGQRDEWRLWTYGCTCLGRQRTKKKKISNIVFCHKFLISVWHTPLKTKDDVDGTPDTHIHVWISKCVTN